MRSSPVRAKDALQPSLLDRLRDDNPEVFNDHANDLLISREQLKAAVLRDLESLLNCQSLMDTRHTQSNLKLAQSVLAYGMPPLAGQTMSNLDIRGLERTVAEMIRRFEPRIQSDSLLVVAEQEIALMHKNNVIGLRISGQLWSLPYPMELLLRTELDLETGHMSIRPLSA